MRLKRVFPRAAVAVLLVAGIAAALAGRQHFAVANLTREVALWGALAPIVYIGLYAAASVLFLPGSILTLAGGALFGPVWGAIYALVAATIGAMADFLIARYLLAEWVATKAGGRLKQLIAGVEAEGWRFVAFTRLVPLIPFNLLNYALGLTRIRFVEYVLATFVCMIPGAIAYAYLGYAGREALAGGEALARNGIIALALVALVAFLPRFVRRLRRAQPSGGFPPAEVSWVEAPDLAARLDPVSGPIVIDVRGPDEFSGELGHLPGACNIPLAALADRLGGFERSAAQELVLVCHTQVRSAQAAAMLEEAGFRNVFVLRGGMVEWARQRLPTEPRKVRSAPV